VGINEDLVKPAESDRAIQGLTSCLKCSMVIGTDNALLLGIDRERLSIAQRRTIAMLGGMQKHLEKKHPRLNAALEVSSMGYLGLLRLMQFRSSDPGVQQERDRSRWNLLQQVLPCRMPDEKIAYQSYKFAQELLELVEDDMSKAGCLQLEWGPHRVPTLNKISAKIRELMTGYRDAVEEPNKYPADSMPVEG
jgi:hypothetical protein